LSDNFRCPYAAVGFSDFWRRWHITLSSWLRDYLYISLGGNRTGIARTYVNLMLTMLLGGLWHGASWTFVVWGALHGLYLVVERVARKSGRAQAANRGRGARFLLSLGTFLVVTVTWVFFRAENFEVALQILHAMTGSAPTGLIDQFTIISVITVVAGMLIAQGLLRNADLERTITELPLWVRGGGIAFFILCILLSPGDDRAFIYFQF
jgi:D-alanyl-lipoteichoic acid acyltransferase DltB (MBOAT superfamily)